MNSRRFHSAMVDSGAVPEVPDGIEVRPKKKTWVVHADCMEWLGRQPDNSFHAIVTDPPFGFHEFTEKELVKLRNGKGGIWRLPPTFDGNERSPLPRFTILSPDELQSIAVQIEAWGKLAINVLRPGGHVFLASNSFISPWVAHGMIKAGFERRGEVIRLVQTIRGGYRPKGAEEEFPGVSVTPRSCYEPWGVYRKPLGEPRVSDNLRRWETGAVRRAPNGNPFPDILRSTTASAKEREIIDFPTLKPQRFLRQIVWAALPLGRGRILDCFAGSGSTVAAALALGYEAVGVEIDEQYARMANQAVPRLATLKADWKDFNGILTVKNQTCLSQPGEAASRPPAPGSLY